MAKTTTTVSSCFPAYDASAVAAADAADAADGGALNIAVAATLLGATVVFGATVASADCYEHAAACSRDHPWFS